MRLSPEQSVYAGEPLVYRQPTVPTRFLFLGRLTPLKGLRETIEILRHVTSPAHLTVAGNAEDGAYLRDVKQLAELLPAHVSVTWLGHASSSESDLIRSHDALVSPTRSMIGPSSRSAVT
ncbi:glycosyltransferase [Georgenia sp. SUBG003]|uniref:glycosyltransferase n=1 Tax=Georgenia sp. SUBG003 TaxID=1497974 RepID=UPI003AB56FD8